VRDKKSERTLFLSTRCKGSEVDRNKPSEIHGQVRSKSESESSSSSGELLRST
jgi:hypothetical protein